MGNTCEPPTMFKKLSAKGKKGSVEWAKGGGGGKNGTAAAGSIGASSDRDAASETTGPAHSEHSLRNKMTHERRDRDVHKYYETVEVLGVGSMGSVNCVRKKKDKMGGSARPHNARKKSRARQLTPTNLFGVVKRGTGSPMSMKRIGSGSGLKRIGSSQKIKTTGSDLSERSDASSTGIPKAGEDFEVLWAMKSIHLNRVSDPKFVEELKNEIDILKSLDHPNIVRVIETFEHKNQTCLVMELCSGGDLYSRDPYSEEEAARIVRKLLSAVAYMHRCGIMHRDIKYENVLFENDKTNAEIKLVDFGLSKQYFPDAPHMSEGVGTIYTMAPQVLEGSYTNSADIWSIGVVAFMLLSSQMPFYGKKRRHVLEKIMKAQYAFHGKRWEGVSDEAKEFVKSLLQKNPEDRPTAEEALQSKWLADDFFATRCPVEHRQVMTSVQRNLERFAQYSKLKKLSLMVIAHKSNTDEIGFLRDAFERYDVKKDGTISFEEFKTALEEFGYSDQTLERIFKGVDLDGSGLIHYTEFLAATLEAKGVIVEERLAEAFDRLDSDDSGYISKKNLRALLIDGFEGRELTEQLIQEIMDEADLSKDGKISYDDFLQLWENQEEEDVRNTMRGMKPLMRVNSDLSLVLEASVSDSENDSSPPVKGSQ